MTSLSMYELTILVLAPGEAPQAQNHAKGHLFERFVAQLLHRYGYEKPRFSNLNVTSDGVELDVVVQHQLTFATAIAECKAYSRNVKANELTSFYGKLAADRLEREQATFGFMIALPRLTPDGEEKARTIAARDTNFRYLNSDDVVSAMRETGLLVDAPHDLGTTSDPAVIVTEDGVFSAAVILDPASRTPKSITVWSANGIVPIPTLDLVRASPYAVGLQVSDAHTLVHEPTREPIATDTADESLFATVLGSGSDFEYQLPASPRYFVGRKELLARLERSLDSGERVVVFNAKSGWGKSSLALKLAQFTKDRGGHALVLDTRTANTSRYIVEVLRRAALEAADLGLLTLPNDPSWGSLVSALNTLKHSAWIDPRRPLLLFFDQFENVFRDPELTRSFRDLTAGVRELDGKILVGYAWKTDLVGWTEGHPYQLRDEIRQMAAVFAVDPFGPTEVSTLLGRLEKHAGTRIVPDLKLRLREYSQGFPWLLKKLSDHVLKELAGGISQEQLIAEALNVQSLFEADLSELTPVEHEALRHIARFAPIMATEVTERYSPTLVQSLVNRRLIVQVGERLDTYWDTFRDFLNTGRVPVEDSYILRQTTRQIARLLPLVLAAEGNAYVPDLASALDTSDRAIFNLSRELRLLGVTTHEPLRVKLSDEVWTAPDRERALRRRVASSLRRHRAFSTFVALAERSAGSVSLSSYGRELPNAFPAVEASVNTWTNYARSSLSWMTYAGLIVQRGNDFFLAPEGYEQQSIRLLDVRSPLRVRRALPQEACGPAIELIQRIGRGEVVSLPEDGPKRDAARTTIAIGAVSVTPEGTLVLTRSDLAPEGVIDPLVLREMLTALPGAAAGLLALEGDPSLGPQAVGEILREAAGASWTESSTYSMGGRWRSWARAAGLTVTSPRRTSPATDDSGRIF
ncbi:restriction endonuclease [Streptomyces sp. NPDC056485]|uniref:nSTAND1 domain-containing NTPase n=1 Tax=Streptomyces sp. NPDC056485 TaxID=3345834 RepID=UPI00369E34C0